MWNDTTAAICAPASIPTTLRRPVCVTIPVASMVNSANVLGIYLASDERYTESELPTSFGPRTGAPEEGIDHTFILYAGPSTQH